MQPDGPFFFLTMLSSEMRDASLGLLVAGLTGVLLLGSCGLTGSGEEEKAKADSTYFRAMFNGKEMWAGEEIRATFSEGKRFSRWLTIIADTVHKQHYPYTERLVIVAIFEGVGAYSLTEIEREWDETGSAYYENDGDVLIASYHPTENTSANRLTITHYDSTAGVLEGTFRTTVVVDSAERASEPGAPSRRRPDTLRFTDGEFRVKVGYQ